MTVSFSSYSLPSGEVLPFEEQVLVDNVTGTYGPGTHHLTVDAPESCAYQTDLYMGEVIYPLTSGAHHNHNGTNYLIKYDLVNLGQPCGDTPPPPGEVCDEAENGCLKVELVEVVTNADGTTTYNVRVTYNCHKGLSYAAVELPHGVEAISYSTGWPIVDVENPGGTGGWHNPNFRNLKFEFGGDIKNGDSVELSYTLPAGASYSDGLRVQTKGGWYKHKVTLDPSECTDPCVLDEGPPSIEFTAVNEGGLFVDVRVTDDTALDEVTYTIGGDVGSLSFVSRTDVSDAEVQLRFSIDDPSLNGTLAIDATDECQKAACLDDSPPVITAVNGTELLLNGDGGLIEDPNKPGFAWQLDGRGVASDDQGVLALQFFLMNNTRVMLLDESGFEPTIDFQLDPPPVGVVDPAQLGSTTVPFTFQGLVAGPFSFGALAADQCNAYVYDPAGTSEGPGAARGTAGSGEGLLSLVSAQPPAFARTQADSALPEHFELEGNYPNPFSSATTIRFALPEAADVRMVVYDVLGREVAVLVEESLIAGFHEVAFDGRGLASGVYIIRIETPTQNGVKQMTLMK